MLEAETAVSALFDLLLTADQNSNPSRITTTNEHGSPMPYILGSADSIHLRYPLCRRSLCGACYVELIVSARWSHCIDATVSNS